MQGVGGPAWFEPQWLPRGPVPWNPLAGLGRQNLGGGLSSSQNPSVGPTGKDVMY